MEHLVVELVLQLIERAGIVNQTSLDGWNR
jgi:hypothetical protein